MSLRGLKPIKYKGGYKYQLAKDAVFQTNITGFSVNIDYITLLPNGLLFLKKGYAWDGATLFPDIKSIMRGSLVHDALYQLMREGLLPQSARILVDKEFIGICKQDGMMSPVRWTVYQAVRKFAASAASIKNAKPIMSAP